MIADGKCDLCGYAPVDVETCPDCGQDYCDDCRERHAATHRPEPRERCAVSDADESRAVYGMKND